MTRRRWIADEVSGDRAALVGSHAQHLSLVLRARIGQNFDVVADGVLRCGRVSSISDDRVEFELGEKISTAAVPGVTLAISIFKFDRLEWAIEKCTELGVARIVPLIARRSETHLVAAAKKRVERWRRIAHQASEQSRRVTPAEITAPMKLKDVVALPGAIRIVLAETEKNIMLKDALSSAPPGGDILLAFGPEGGWTEAEVESFRSFGWQPASLGPTILRSETAVIAAAAIVLSELQ